MFRNEEHFLDFFFCREENSGLKFETMRLMVVHGNFWVVVLLIIGVVGAYNLYNVECLPLPHRILLDADVATDDFLALLYLLKQNRSEFKVEVSSYI